MRIFTHSIISPGLSLRQCPSRCTFRAGRNLPDKEFRYLRTVIVTAAVYCGFGSMLWDKSLTNPLNLPGPGRDRKSTRLNSSHVALSYAVFCLKKKNLVTAPAVCTSLDHGVSVVHPPPAHTTNAQLT